MKAIKQYFPVVLFIMLYKVVLTFESVDEILKYDHSNESTEQYFPVMLFIHDAVQGSSNFSVRMCDQSIEKYRTVLSVVLGNLGTLDELFYQTHVWDAHTALRLSDYN